MNWTIAYINFDGSAETGPGNGAMADIDRFADDVWKTILNLPGLVVIEWVGDYDPTYFRYIIHVRTDS